MYVNRNATLMRAACRRAMLFYVVQLLALPSGFGGSPASFGSCAQCVEAGFGWSERLGRCGMFKNQACATPTTIPQPPQRVSPPITTPGPATEISVQVYDGPTDCAPSQRARNGHWVRAHYTGVIEYCPKRGPDRQKNRHCSLLRGSEFGSSRKDGHAAYDFQLGVESVIKGWDVGIVDLCKGARATLIIPPELGYGSATKRKIPANATLKFDVEIIDVFDSNPILPATHETLSPPPPASNFFNDLDLDGDAQLSRAELLAFFEAQGKHELAPGLWDDEDKNGDGVVTLDKFGRAHEMPPSDREL